MDTLRQPFLRGELLDRAWRLSRVFQVELSRDCRAVERQRRLDEVPPECAADKDLSSILEHVALIAGEVSVP